MCLNACICLLQINSNTTSFIKTFADWSEWLIKKLIKAHRRAALSNNSACAVVGAALRTELASWDCRWLMILFQWARAVLLDLCNSLELRLSRGAKKPQHVPPHVPMLSALSSLDTRTVQREAGDLRGIHKNLSATHSQMCQLVTLNWVKLCMQDRLYKSTTKFHERLHYWPFNNMLMVLLILQTLYYARNVKFFPMVALFNT